MVGTTSPRTFADLPTKGQLHINAKYKDYSIGQIYFFDDNELNESDMRLYDMQFEDADSYFVELEKGDKKIVLKINPQGDLFFFKQL